MKDIKNYNLLEHNTFGIAAQCSRFVEIETVDEACSILPTISASPYIIIGGGSNLLLTGDYEGTVLRSAIRGIDIHDGEAGEVLVRCGSGEVVDDVIDYTVARGIYGAENLSLIPGEVGASAVQNIGAYGAEVKDIIRKVEAVEIATGEMVVFSNEQCEYSYRQSRFKKDWKNRFFITHVTYALSREFKPALQYGNIIGALAEKGITTPTAQQLRDTIIEIRQAKLPDPKVLGNGGSFFMNPIVGREQFEQLFAQYPDMPHYDVDADHVKIPAGWMIDRCGWKGKSMGRAGVYEKQALVLVNLGGAKGSEIVALCKQIQKDVKEKFGIEIHPEVNVI